MISSKLRLCATFAAFVFASALPAAAVSVVNGGFEHSGHHPGPWQNMSGHQLHGWIIDNGSNIELINTHWVASSGDYSIDLNGHRSAGNIYQSVSGFVVGKNYMLEFDMSGNANGPVGAMMLTASVGGTSDVFHYDTVAKGNSNSDMKWETMSMAFKATSETMDLRFASGASSSWGAALDNVSIATAPVPLPAAGLMLAAALGTLAMRRRRRA